MIKWLAENWFWIVFAIIFVAMHMFGHGGYGRYGNHGDQDGQMNKYTGLFIALFGEGVVHWPTIFSVGLFPVIVVVYTLLARREEKEVIEQFGEEYLEYRSNIPMFLPVKDKWKQFVANSDNNR